MKENISIIVFGFITISISLLTQSYVNYQQTNRLNEHKKVIIELTNKHNAMINYLKAKEYGDKQK